MTTVLCTGTFDMLHAGHLYYFEQAKKLGTNLIVVVSRDKTVIQERKQTPIMHENDRLKLIQSLKLVDTAVLGSETDKLKTIEELKPDVICLGYDQKIDERQLESDLKQRNLTAKIVRLPPFRQETYKSSKLKELL
ncbi:MAG TPA: adenylyltransferase/cytidyltransferase family protein [Candidatus Nanoarchaeia archaeon]|nr:adenylyltransferase/cytidyltransferase family protein [Candidatus Nanoarchaeia archaeon]